MAAKPMSAQIAVLAKRRGRLPALVTSLLLLAYLLVQDFLGNVIGYLNYAGYQAMNPLNGGGPYAFGPNVDGLVHYALPFVVGVFISLWQIAPIADELTLRFVLTRAALAAAMGGVVVVVVNFALAFFTSFGGGLGFNTLDFTLDSVAAITNGLGSLVGNFAVTLLAGLLLWFWLRAHPRDYDIAGLIDEL